MPSLDQAKASNSSYKFPAGTPVAVFVGGTSGVGEAMARIISNYASGNIDIVIVGRNRDAAEKTFASLPRPNGADGNPVLREFVACDASLMKNIKVACDELKSKLRKINYLVLSLGYLQFTKRDETEEGMDKMLVMRYYCRFKYITELMPLLESAKAANEDTSVLSILAPTPSNGAKVRLEDMDLKKSYSTFKCITATSVYNDIMIEEFSKRHPDIAFIHIHPGFVDSPAYEYFYNTCSTRMLKPIVNLAIRFAAITPDHSAEIMLHALWADKNGWHRRGSDAEDLGSKHYNHSEKVKESVWEHSCLMTNI